MHGADRVPSLRDRRILVVEDEWFIVADLVDFLTERGVVLVGPASNLRDGLALVRDAERIDGAILNIDLHGDASYPIADALRRRGVPFAFASGVDLGKVPALYADVPYVTKPYETAAVVRALFEQAPAVPTPS